VANGLFLALLARQGGGELQGIAYWNYNVKEQGLYNDIHDTAYEVETMFERVSAVLPLLRQLMTAPAGQPRVLVLAPPARSHEEIGRRRAPVLLEVQPFQRLAILAKEGVNAAVVDSLQGWLEGETLAGRVRAVVVLTPRADHLAVDDLAALRDYLQGGGIVVTSPGVGAFLAGAARGEPELGYGGLVEQRGNLYLAQKGVAVLFEDQRHEVLTPFWWEVLGLAAPQPGYRIVTDRYVFHYHIGAEPVEVRTTQPYPASGYRYNDEARAVQRLHSLYLGATLGRREYLLLWRDWWPRPWFV
jgi:hypothetical protein